MIKAYLAVGLMFACGFATADTFVIRSVDGGRTWTDIDPGPPHQLLRYLNVSPGTSALYALTQTRLGGETRLLVSNDDGQTWRNQQGFPESMQNLAAGPVSPDTLYLAHQDGFNLIIDKVTDNGQTVERYPAEGLTIVASTASQSIGAFLTRLLVDPATPSRLYALITNEFRDNPSAFFQALWSSTDGGRIWRRLEPPVNPNCDYPQIWIASSDSSLYLFCGPSEFLRSTDGGESWTRKVTPDGGRLFNLQIGSGTKAILYTASGGVLWRSTDGAESWQRSGVLPAGVNDFQIDAANPLVIFGAGRTGAWRSDDGGETWTRLADYNANFQLLADPRAPGTLYGYSLERQEARLNDRQTYLRSLAGEKQTAPGSLVSIYGRNLAAQTLAAASTPLPISLGGVSVSFDGRSAPLLYVSADQINAQAPFGLAPETVGNPATTSVILEVRRSDASLDRQTVSLSPRAAFVVRENLSRQSAPLLFHASDFRPISADDPARRGEAITLFALGLGELEPSLAAGELPPSPPPQLANAPCVVFSEQPGSVPLAAAPSRWAGAAPGLIGVYQVNLDLPASLGPGSYVLSLTERRLGDVFSKECKAGYQGNLLDWFTLDVQ
ncbi:MAG: hypothetical protein ACRD8O_20240 [Bryobacteraceae bacterium]